MKKINKNDIEAVLALTPMQEGLLFHYLKAPESDLYIEQLCLELSGDIEIDRFERSWDAVVETNDMLRTLFRWEQVKEPVQLVLKKHRLKPRYYNLQEYDIENSSPMNRVKRVKTIIEELKVKDRDEGFDLREVPFRVTLYQISERKFYMMLSHHHILYDGWSTGIVLQEFFNIYSHLSHGEPPAKPVKTPFKDFIKWFQKRDVNKEKEFWKNYLRGFDTQIEFPIKRKENRRQFQNKVSTGGMEPGGKFCNENKVSQYSNIEIVPFPFETSVVNHFIKKYKITLATLFYTAWGLLLQKYNNSNDVIFGTTVSGRTTGLEGIEKIVGLFINTLPLRVQGSPGEKAIGLLHRINHELQIRRPCEHTPLVTIKEISEIDRKEELFDSIVVVENYPLNNPLKTGDLSLCSYSIKEMTHYDLTITITGPWISGNELEINYSYKTGVLDKKSIERLSRHFASILHDIIKNPWKKVFELDILSGEEKRRLLVEFNQAKAQYPKDKFLQQLFTEQVTRTPDHISLIGKGQLSNINIQGSTEEASLSQVVKNFDEMYLSYKKLSEKSGELAGILRDKGVLTDTIVGIEVERSVEMVICIFGILKAGAAYMPIDPDYPRDRIAFMLKDSNAKILLTTREIACLSSPERFKTGLQSTSLSGIRDLVFGISPRQGSQLAYVIYTSGSTGCPKGVMVDHASIVNTLSALDRMYTFTTSDVYLLKTSYLFDVSLTELFGWFLGNRGGRLVVLEPGEEKDPAKILDTIEKMNITHINFVPSMFNVFVDQLTDRSIGKLPNLKYIFLAGEALLPELVNKFRQLDNTIPMEDLYGPTEAAIYASRYSLADWNGGRVVPIGKPIQNVKLYILDRNNRLQPVEVPGELMIAGAGLARGYLNRPELTAEKFDHDFGDFWDYYNDYSSYKSHKSYIIYRTGDLARWLEDGNIEFLGRIDHQVKVRGFRVEIGEIERCLVTHHKIKQAVVTVRHTSGGGANLCAYLVTGHTDYGTGLVKSRHRETSNEIPAASELREYLSQSLPGYMIPSYFIQMEQFPLNSSGKVDRLRLPAPRVRWDLEVSSAAPGNDVEKMIAHAWKKVRGYP